MSIDLVGDCFICNKPCDGSNQQESMKCPRNGRFVEHVSHRKCQKAQAISNLRKGALVTCGYGNRSGISDGCSRNTEFLIAKEAIEDKQLSTIVMSTFGVAAAVIGARSTGGLAAAAAVTGGALARVVATVGGSRSVERVAFMTAFGASMMAIGALGTIAAAGSLKGAVAAAGAAGALAALSGSIGAGRAAAQKGSIIPATLITSGMIGASTLLAGGGLLMAGTLSVVAALASFAFRRP